MSVWLGFAALWAPSFAPSVQSSRNPLADSSVLGSGGQTEKQVNCDAEESWADAGFDVKDNPKQESQAGCKEACSAYLKTKVAS